MGEEEEGKVFDVIDIAVDDIIQNENEEKQQNADGRRDNSGAKFFQSRLAVNMLVVADKSVQHQPVDGQEDDAEIEFVVVRYAFGKMAEQGVVNIVFPIYKKQHPGQHGGQNVEENVEESQSSFVHRCVLVQLV